MPSPRNKTPLTAAELSVLCYQFSVVFRSGMTYLEGLDVLAEDIFDTPTSAMIGAMAEDVKEGMRLNQAMHRQSAFPAYLVQMVAIAEETGTVAEVFEQLSQYYEQNDLLTHEIKSALAYPALILLLMTGVILLLVGKVLPVFREILLSVGGEVPEATAFVFRLSSVIQVVIIAVLSVLILLGAYIWAVFRFEGLSRYKDRLLLRLPVVRQAYRDMMTLRFIGALKILSRSGLPFQNSLGLIIPIMGSAHYEDRLRHMSVQVDQGVGMDEALSEVPEFPSLLAKLLKVARKTGTLDDVLETLAETYDRALKRRLKRITAVLEPALVMILSIMVGGILLLVMLPLIQIMSSIG